jgi:hypothetical protein
MSMRARSLLARDDVSLHSFLPRACMHLSLISSLASTSSCLALHHDNQGAELVGVVIANRRRSASRSRRSWCLSPAATTYLWMAAVAAPGICNRVFMCIYFAKIIVVFRKLSLFYQNQHCFVKILGILMKTQEYPYSAAPG